MFSLKFYFILCAISMTKALLDSNSMHQDFKIKKSEKTINDVKRGDQALDGVHTFEFHAKGGGIGVGLKVMVFGVIAIFVMYWCLKEKCLTATHQ